MLTRLVSQIGWDELLKTRSQVFVMEEEYRMQKTQGDIQRVLSATSPNGSSLGNAVIHEDGTVVRPSIDDQASTRGIKALSPAIATVSIADANGNDDEPVSAVPTIRISTESSRGNDSKEEENLQKKPVNDDGEEKEEPESDTVDRKKEKGKSKEVYADDGQETNSDMPSANGVQQNGVQNHGLERPVQAAGEGNQNVNEASPAPAQEPFSFSNKRLCERWLDNLFMVLYEVGYSSFLVSQIIQQQI